MIFSPTLYRLASPVAMLIVLFAIDQLAKNADKYSVQ